MLSLLFIYMNYIKNKCHTISNRKAQKKPTFCIHISKHVKLVQYIGRAGWGTFSS